MTTIPAFQITKPPKFLNTFKCSNWWKCSIHLACPNCS